KPREWRSCHTYICLSPNAGTSWIGPSAARHEYRHNRTRPGQRCPLTESPGVLAPCSCRSRCHGCVCTRGPRQHQRHVCQLRTFSPFPPAHARRSINIGPYEFTFDGLRLNPIAVGSGRGIRLNALNLVRTVQRGQKVLLDHVSLSAAPGEFLAI